LSFVVASGRVGVQNPRARACFMLQTIRNISVQVRGVSSIRTSHFLPTIPHYLKNFGGVKLFFRHKKNLSMGNFKI